MHYSAKLPLSSAGLCSQLGLLVLVLPTAAVRCYRSWADLGNHLAGWKAPSGCCTHHRADVLPTISTTQLPQGRLQPHSRKAGQQTPRTLPTSTPGRAGTDQPVPVAAWDGPCVQQRRRAALLNNPKALLINTGYGELRLALKCWLNPSKSWCRLIGLIETWPFRFHVSWQVHQRKTDQPKQIHTRLARIRSGFAWV